MDNSVDETICAVATPSGEGGIGIIRVSGARAIDIAAHVVRPRNRRPLQRLTSHRLYMSDVIDAPGPSAPAPPPPAHNGAAADADVRRAKPQHVTANRGDATSATPHPAARRRDDQNRADATSADPRPAAANCDDPTRLDSSATDGADRRDGADAAPLDEALVVVMRRPHSYTGEDVVEIHAHGGARILQMTCRCLIRHGARLAQPGEFTKRAFLSGRLDLAQAEAVLDTIQATTAGGLRAAQSLLRGALSREIDTHRDRLTWALAHLEAGMDFVEEDIATAHVPEVQRALEDTHRALGRLIASYEDGRLIRDGVVTAIIGRPNVGKSSLLNALLDAERVIVSPQPGTTRDIVDASLTVGGVALRMLDTAGLRQTDDPVEGEGIRRAEDAIADADVLLLVIDGSVGATAADRALLDTHGHQRCLLVVNKMDLPGARLPSAWLSPSSASPSPSPVTTTTASATSTALSPPASPSPPPPSASPLVTTTTATAMSPPSSPSPPVTTATSPPSASSPSPLPPSPSSPAWPGNAVAGVVAVSAKTGDGLDRLRAALRGLCVTDAHEPPPSVQVTRLRHQSHLVCARAALDDALQILRQGASGECLALDIRAALDSLGEITGAVSTEDVLDRIFREFCIGK